ncbi:MAG TPA: hypothetical protein VK961_12590 [Chthoniobacter sp.]|nr:hypothetical protein [Chthoniobacter sp.]
MKNKKINPFVYVARVLGYALLLAGFLWLFIVIPMFTHVVSRRVIQHSDARLAERTQSTFTTRDIETEVRASIQDAFDLYPKHIIPTLLMVAGGIFLAYTPPIKLETAPQESVSEPAPIARRPRKARVVG